MTTTKPDPEKSVLDKIALMPEPDRSIGEKIHAIVKAQAPDLTPRLWYGMPAYANKDGKVILFFRDTQKFKERYMTLGFNQEATLDDGIMWPIAFAITKLSPKEEKQIAELVKRAVN